MAQSLAMSGALGGEVNCCLCFRSLTDSTSRKKRKRLHSDRCNHLKQILEGLLLSTRNATLADFVETMLGAAYLCYQCDGKANSLHKLQQRVTEIQNKLLDKLRGLHEVTSIGPRKGLHTNEQSSTDKRPRLDSQCSQDVPETNEVSSNQLHLEQDDVNSGDHGTLSESYNLLESESNPLAMKSKSPTLSVSINILSYLTSLVILCNHKLV